MDWHGMNIIERLLGSLLNHFREVLWASMITIMISSISTFSLTLTGMKQLLTQSIWVNLSLKQSISKRKKAMTNKTLEMRIKLFLSLKKNLKCLAMAPTSTICSTFKPKKKKMRRPLNTKPSTSRQLRPRKKPKRKNAKKRRRRTSNPSQWFKKERRPKQTMDSKRRVMKMR